MSNQAYKLHSDIQHEQSEITKAISDAYQRLFQQEDINLSTLLKFKSIQEKQRQQNDYLNNQIKQYTQKIAELETTLYFKQQSQQKQPQERILIPRTSPKQQNVKTEKIAGAMVSRGFQLKDATQNQEIIKKLEQKLRVKQKVLQHKNQQVISLKTKFKSKFQDIQTSVALKAENQKLLLKQKQQEKKIQELIKLNKQFSDKQIILKNDFQKKQQQIKQQSQKNKQLNEQLSKTTKLYIETGEKLKSRQEEMQKNLKELRNQLMKKMKQQLTNYFKEKEKMKEQFNAKIQEKDKLIYSIVTGIQNTTKYKKKTTEPLESWLENAKKYLNQNIQVGQAQQQLIIQKKLLENRDKMMDEDW